MLNNVHEQYADLQAKIEDLEQEKTTLIKLGQEDSRYQNLLSETQSLRAKVEELEKQLKDALHLLFKSEDE